MPRKTQRRSGTRSTRSQNVDGMLRASAGAENLRTSNVGTGQASTAPDQLFLIRGANSASGATTGQATGPISGTATAGPSSNVPSSSGSTREAIVIVHPASQMAAINAATQGPANTAASTAPAVPTLAVTSEVPQPPPGVSLPAGFSHMATHPMDPPPRPSTATTEGTVVGSSPVVNQGLFGAARMLEPVRRSTRINAATQTSGRAQNDTGLPQTEQDWEPVSGMAAFAYNMGQVRFWRRLWTNTRKRAISLRSRMRIGRVAYRGIMLQGDRVSEDLTKLMLYLEVRATIRILAIVLFLMYLELPWVVYQILRDLAIFVILGILYLQFF